METDIDLHHLITDLFSSFLQDVSSTKMDDRRNVENEELRKQIQFLTDIIKKAKSEKKYFNQTHGTALPDQTPSVYSHKYSKPYSSSFSRLSSRPELIDSAFYNKQLVSAQNSSLYHLDTCGSGTGLLKPSSGVPSKVINNEKEDLKPKFAGDEIKSGKLQADFDSNFGTWTTGNLGGSVPSYTMTYSRDKIADVSKQDASLKMKLHNQMAVKPKSSSKCFKANPVETKSSVSSSNLNQSSSKSDPILLQREIEKMHNKITELKKMISERKVTGCKELTHSLSAVSELSLSRKKVATESISISTSKDNFLMQKSTCSTFLNKSSSFSEDDLNRVLSESPKKADAKKNMLIGVQRATALSSSDCQKINQTSITLVDKNTQSQNDLVAVSKYKLTRVGLSPTKQPSLVTEKQENRAISSLLSRQEITSSKSEPVKSSFKKESALISESSVKTPVKFIKNSKYSITRVRNSGKKGLSKNKLPRSHSNTPAKFIRYSNYAIKRARKTSSGYARNSMHDSESSFEGTGKYKNVSCSLGSAQKGVTVLKSKFKMEKIPLPKVVAKNHYKLSQYGPHYKLDGDKFYRQKHYQSYRLKDEQWQRWYTRYGYPGYVPKGRHTCSNMYKRRGRVYQGLVGRYQKGFQYPYYGRRHAVSQRYIQRRIQLLKKDVPFNPKHKLDRRTLVTDSKTPANFVMINGILYKSSAKTLEKAVTAKTPTTALKVHQTTIKKSLTSNMKTVTVRGVKFEVDSHGRSLKRVHPRSTPDGVVGGASSSHNGQVSRIDIGGVTYIQTKPGTLERVGSVKTRKAAARVVNKTVQRVAAKYKKDNTKVKKKNTYCMFYNRFGKCNKKGSCSYIHDPEKVAVCTRFLRGTCKVKDCPFSHKVSKDKMPVCSYFLKGVCNRDECPYLHVNVNKNAEICEDFLKGYCPHAEKCKKKHILNCPEFSKTGVCSKGEKCKLQHRKGKKRMRQISEESVLENGKKAKLSDKIELTSVNESRAVLEQLKAQLDSDVNLPFKERKLPAYISLKTGSTSGSKQENEDCHLEKQKVKPAMRIRPQF